MIVMEREPSSVARVVSALPARKVKRRNALKPYLAKYRHKNAAIARFRHGPHVSQFKGAFMAARRSFGRTDGRRVKSKTRVSDVRSVPRDPPPGRIHLRDLENRSLPVWWEGDEGIAPARDPDRLLPFMAFGGLFPDRK